MVSDTYREISRCAYEVNSKPAFYRGALESVGKLFNSPCSCLYVNMNTEVFDDYYHQGSGDPDFWRPTIQESINDSIDQGKGSLRFFKSKNPEKAPSVAILSTIVYRPSGASVGAIAVTTAARDKDHATLQMKLLESLVNLISSTSDLCEQNKIVNDDKLEACKRLSQAANYSDRHELSYAVTNNLRNRTGCDQVAFGHVHKHKIEILSVSGLSEIKKHSANITSVQDAMEECLDMDEIIFYQATEKSKSGKNEFQREYKLHRKWHEKSGHSAVASIPLHGPSGCEAVLSLKRNGTHPFTTEELNEIRALAEPYTAVFGVIEKANRNILEHTFSSVCNTVVSVVKPEKWSKKVITLCMMLFTAWFFFGTVEYKITVPGKITPEKLQHISNPNTAELAENFVRLGDRVKAGDILCRFNTDSLDLVEREKLLSEMKIAKIQLLSSQSKSDAVAARLAQASYDLAHAKLNILDRQVEQATMRAPFDGIVVRGDLSKRIGEIIPQSEPLFEIAALGKWEIELEASEFAAADIKPGLDGIFITNARPDTISNVKIKNISPGAQLYKNQNVYIAEAEVDINEPWVKAGMEGVTKVTVGRRKVYWVVLHKIINYAYLKFWL